MSDKISLLHDSQNPYYRFPLGACGTETTIYLSIDLTMGGNVSLVQLRMWRDSVGEEIKAMYSPDKKHYTCQITAPDKGCVLWYYFIVRTPEGSLFYGNNAQQTGGEGQLYSYPPPSFQITVYRADAVTPDWFKHAVMYQLFPDRFYRHGDAIIPKKNAVYHADWHDKPYYYKDEDNSKIVSYDFFGGNLAGIKEKLSYLKELGISVIYMNPVFESESNHRYDTGDYHKIDPILGTNEEFADLCDTAKNMGINIIIDGVFSHTGSNSIYFNRSENYDSLGAYQSKKSPYYEWYTFHNFPNEYDSWWGFDTLPDVTETMPSYMNFIINDDDSVLHHWLKAGISGWRLDVIDELPQKFSRHFYKELKKIKKDAVLIGEVWEDASNKVSYSVPREYLCGYEMDSAMNYPFRKIVLDFLLKNETEESTMNHLLSQKENYPAQNYYAMMNLVTSHDVERVLTLLGQAPSCKDMTALQQADYKLDPKHYQLGIKRCKIAALWQMTFPGVPSIYYGDEIGMQGFRDPHNRGAYQWDSGNEELRSWTKKLVGLRNANTALQTGQLVFLYACDDVLVYLRYIKNHQDVFGEAAEDDAFVVLFNRGSEDKNIQIDLHGYCHTALVDALDKTQKMTLQISTLKIKLEGLTGKVLRQEKCALHYRRNCGILLHPTCLYTKYGIGDFGEAAFSFADWLQKSGQSYWQILPLNPVGFGASPYQSASVFAGNYLLISPDELVKDGLLKKDELYYLAGAGQTDFSAVAAKKGKLLRSAFVRFQADASYKAFCREESFWLDDYALYCTLKKIYGDASWTEWPDALKKHQTEALEEAAAANQQEINYIKFVQYTFFKQWIKLKKYAQQKNIKIIGDMPIFPSHDSADVWANQGLFNLKEDGSCVTVAGVPPDYFSENGQLWGNPHYDWVQMAKDDYKWWVERFKTLYKLADVIRLDHFRGFAAYWAVDGKAETARTGKWEKGPGLKFFEALRTQLGDCPIIAEDLGVITDDVEQLKNKCGFPGMKVLQFELYGDKRGNMEFFCAENNIVYTGTHDNNTTIGWLKNDISSKERAAFAAHFKKYKATAAELSENLMKCAYESCARTAILPLQDVLLLDGTARMNLPGTVGNNWSWQLSGREDMEKATDFLKGLCKKYNR